MAADLDGGGFDAGLFALGLFEIFDLEAVFFGPARVHAQQHLRPVLAFGAARAGMDGDDGALGVVRSGEQHLRFDLRQPLREVLDFLREVGENVLAFARQLEERVEIGGAGRQLGFLFERFLEALAFLVDLLAVFGLAPEIGRRNLLFELG